MKIAVVNSSEFAGGAAIACRRLLESLRTNSVDAKLICRDKKSNNPYVIDVDTSFLKKKVMFFFFAIEQVFFKLFKQSKQEGALFSPGWFGYDITKLPEIKEASVINLHWINNSFLSIKGMKQLFGLKKPIVWHLHDMWAFTGGCHYSGTCTNFFESCGHCPFLKSHKRNDISNKIWKEKKSIYNNKDQLVVVTPSLWLMELAKKSSLFKGNKIYCIPNPIDTNIFKPHDKLESRKRLGLNPNKKYILFTAMNVSHKRKGFLFLKNGIEVLKNNKEFSNIVELMVVGKTNKKIHSEISGVVNINWLGSFSDEKKMVDVYNAADLFVIPSLEDNLPNTIMESMACGTPVVGFNTGGIPEMIDHKHNGYVAEYKSTSDMVNGILWVLFQSDYRLLKENARDKVVNNYTYSIIANQYIDLYSKLDI